MGDRNMTRAEKAEAYAFIYAITAALLAAAGGFSSAASAELRRACGLLDADFVAMFKRASIGDALAACFAAAGAAGASLDALARVRGVAEALTPTTFAGFVVRNASVRLCLVAETRALAASTIETRSQAETLLARFNAAFDAAGDIASDAGDPEMFRALVELHSAVVRDLWIRARSLPEVVSYEFRRALPSLYIANRLYGDASRAGELVAENRARHPAFMPRSGVALTA